MRLQEIMEMIEIVCDWKNNAIKNHFFYRNETLFGY